MIRTQVYLTKHQHDALSVLAKATGKSRSELIREAIGLVIAQPRRNGRAGILKAAAGMWKRRKDLPDFQSLRRGWN